MLAVHQSEVSVKRLPQKEGPLVLQPSNRACEAMQVDDETAIEGKVIGAAQTPECPTTDVARLRAEETTLNGTDGSSR